MDAAVNSDALFDKDFLAKYTLGDRSLEAEVLQMFLDQAKVYRQRLLEAADAESWRDAAHSLKGSARGVGAFKLAGVAEELEQIQQGFAGLDRTPLIARLDEQLRLTGGAMERHLQAA